MEIRVLRKKEIRPLRHPYDLHGMGLMVVLIPFHLLNFRVMNWYM